MMAMFNRPNQKVSPMTSLAKYHILHTILHQTRFKMQLPKSTTSNKKNSSILIEHKIKIIKIKMTKIEFMKNKNLIDCNKLKYLKIQFNKFIQVPIKVEFQSLKLKIIYSCPKHTKLENLSKRRKLQKPRSMITGIQSTSDLQKADQNFQLNKPVTMIKRPYKKSNTQTHQISHYKAILETQKAQNNHIPKGKENKLQPLT